MTGMRSERCARAHGHAWTWRGTKRASRSGRAIATWAGKRRCGPREGHARRAAVRQKESVALLRGVPREGGPRQGARERRGRTLFCFRREGRGLGEHCDTAADKVDFVSTDDVVTSHFCNSSSFSDDGGEHAGQVDLPISDDNAGSYDGYLPCPSSQRRLGTRH